MTSELFGKDDPDIGLCDDCGLEEGRRFRTVISGTWDGVPGRCIAWLCGSCKRARQAAPSSRGDADSTPLR